MLAKEKMNERVVLACRPGKDSVVQEQCFRTDSCAIGAEMDAGQVQLDLICLSVDPYMRCRFNEATGADYMGPFEIGEAVTSGGAAMVTASKNAEYEVGDVVVSQMFLPWQQVQVLSPQSIPDLSKNIPGIDPLLAAGPLGMPGLSAYHGVTQCKPVAGEICVLSSCAGGVGSIAGQLLRRKGLRVIGICGSQEKCDWSLEHGVCDVALSYRDERFKEKLAEQCGGKVNLYFDNVGGWISEQVILQLASKGRVIVCGQISSYNQDTTRDDYVYPDPLSQEAQAAMDRMEATRERFFVGWYTDQNLQALQDMQQMIQQGQLNIPVHYEYGLSKAGQAFCDMMQGKYSGKVMVRCTEP